MQTTGTSSAITDDRPEKSTFELPASIHRDLVACAEVLSKEKTGQSIADPAKRVRPMLERFMAADRAFGIARRTMQSSSETPGGIEGKARFDRRSAIDLQVFLLIVRRR
ncbi:DUF2274 domain-containing protein [Rhodopseudomonas palustris]|uniref:DUF2274 domain-containing protein n=1 Tax=Rhodopseudomonas palustris TaxID=1076 RepID=UPI0009B5B7E8